MLPITSVWKQYFKNHHEGLGTTYERFVLHNYFKKIKSKYSVQSVLEVPSFGMTGVSGINSMWWALEATHVTVVDHSRERIDLIEKVWRELSLSADFIYNLNDYKRLPFEDSSFDMGWNFAALWFIPNLNVFLKELTRVSRKVIFICIPNRSNLFHLLRILSNKKSDNLYEENINPAKIKKIMLKYNWQINEKGYLDIPPWPDIAMKKEDLLKKIGLKQLANKMKTGDENHICILDYFSGKKKNMDKEILKYAFLENSPGVFQRIWAHHQYFIFTPIPDKPEIRSTKS
ncbi:hypothetical protein ES705_11595 [subsurface metagenome]